MKTADGHTAIFINVEYDEPKPQTYRGVQVKCNRLKKTFNTKNPTFDFNCACVYIGACQKLQRMGGMILFGSSVDHFEMDCGIIKVNPTLEDLQIAKDWMTVKGLLPS